MRVLIFTSSGGTAHDAAAYALEAWLRRWDPNGEVLVEHILEKASWFTRGGVALYNWIQRHGPWMHQIYWRLVEFEDVTKPGTLLAGRSYVIRILRRFQPDLLISTHPHINRGHFDLARRVCPEMRCITCCTELDGGFGFSRNWFSKRAEAFWTLTPEVSSYARRQGYRTVPAPAFGPLFDPAFDEELFRPEKAATADQLPLLVLGAGANGANNHVRLLEMLLPLAGRVRVVALCGRRQAALHQLRQWAEQHPQLSFKPLGFQGPAEMASLYKQSWAMVARPGARTATEALAAGCVLIFNGFGTTMPQELLARRYFKARQIDCCIRKPQDLLNLCRGWLDQPEHYQKLKERVSNHRLIADQEAIRSLLFDGYSFD
ncbi:monogalactosyldiacylglycerol (MGDG) synthase family protein [Synechococcus sp. PROS-9-1]|nr:monogalactosyldiacylglycerol (MGDG) synthase family protein [Synechococcus sp. PROS-9-1]